MLHPRLWLRDSTTKAARRKCQRILGKQSKASELMQQGTEGEILVQISPLLFSHCTEYIYSPQLVPYLPLSLALFSSPSLTMEVKQTSLRFHENRSSNLWGRVSFFLWHHLFLSLPHFLFILLEVCTALLFQNDTNDMLLLLLLLLQHSFSDCLLKEWLCPKTVL